MIELWGPLQHLAWLAGVEWPQGNEDEMWALGGDWRTAADELDDIVADIIEAKRASLHAYPEGDGVTEMIAAFDSLISGDGSDKDQSVPKLAGYFRDLGQSAYDTGTEIEYTKLMYISSLVLLAAEIAAAWIFPPTAPAVQAAAVALTRFAVRILGQRVMQAIFRIVANKFVGFMLRHVAIDTILGTIQEVGIQAYQVGAGHRPDFDIGQIAVTVVSSAAGGAAAGPVGDIIGNTLQNETRGMGRQYLNGAITGTVAGFTGGLAGTAAAIPTQFAVIWAQEGFTAEGWDKAMEQTMSTLPQQFGPLALVSGATNGLATGVGKVGANHAYSSLKVGVHSDNYRNTWGDRTFMDRMNDVVNGAGTRSGGLPPGAGSPAGGDGSGGLGGDGTQTSSPARPSNGAGNDGAGGVSPAGTNGDSGTSPSGAGDAGGNDRGGPVGGSPADGAGDHGDGAAANRAGDGRSDAGTGPGQQLPTGSDTAADGPPQAGDSASGDRADSTSSPGGRADAGRADRADSAPGTADRADAATDAAGHADAATDAAGHADSGTGPADRSGAGADAADRSGDGAGTSNRSEAGDTRSPADPVAQQDRSGNSVAGQRDTSGADGARTGRDTGDPAGGPERDGVSGPVVGAPVTGPMGGAATPPAGAVPPATPSGPATSGSNPGGPGPAAPGPSNTTGGTGDARPQPGAPGESRSSSASDGPRARAGLGERSPYPGTDGVRAGRTNAPAPDANNARQTGERQDLADGRLPGDVGDGPLGPEDVLPLPAPDSGPPRDGESRPGSRDRGSRDRGSLAARRDGDSHPGGGDGDTRSRSADDTEEGGTPEPGDPQHTPDPRNRGECARLTLAELREATGSDRITPPADPVGPAGMSRREMEDALGGKLYDYPDPGPEHPRHQPIADELLRQAARMDPRAVAAGRGPRAFVVDEYAGPADEHGVGSHAYSMTVRMDPGTGEYRLVVSDPAAAQRRGFPPDVPAELRHVSATLLDGAGRILPPSGPDGRVRPTVERYQRHNQSDHEVNRQRRETEEQYAARRAAEDADLRSLLESRRAEYLRAMADRVREDGAAGLADHFRDRAAEADRAAERHRSTADDRWDEARRKPKTRISDRPRDDERAPSGDDEDAAGRDQDGGVRRDGEGGGARRDGEGGGVRRDGAGAGVRRDGEGAGVRRDGEGGEARYADEGAGVRRDDRRPGGSAISQRRGPAQESAPEATDGTTPDDPGNPNEPTPGDPGTPPTRGPDARPSVPAHGDSEPPPGSGPPPPPGDPGGPDGGDPGGTGTLPAGHSGAPRQGDPLGDLASFLREMVNWPAQRAAIPPTGAAAEHARRLPEHLGLVEVFGELRDPLAALAELAEIARARGFFDDLDDGPRMRYPGDFAELSAAERYGDEQYWRHEADPELAAAMRTDLLRAGLPVEDPQLPAGEPQPELPADRPDTGSPAARPDGHAGTVARPDGEAPAARLDGEVTPVPRSGETPPDGPDGGTAAGRPGSTPPDRGPGTGGAEHGAGPVPRLESVEGTRDTVAHRLGIDQEALDPDHLGATVSDHRYRTLLRAGAVEALAAAQVRLDAATDPAERAARRGIRDMWARLLGTDPEQVNRDPAQVLDRARVGVVRTADELAALADSAVAARRQPEPGPAEAGHTRRANVVVEGRRVPIRLIADDGDRWRVAESDRAALPAVPGPPAAPARPEPLLRRIWEWLRDTGYTNETPKYPSGSGIDSAGQSLLGDEAGLPLRKTEDPTPGVPGDEHEVLSTKFNPARILKEGVTLWKKRELLPFLRRFTSRVAPPGADAAPVLDEAGDEYRYWLDEADPELVRRELGVELDDLKQQARQESPALPEAPETRQPAREPTPAEPAGEEVPRSAGEIAGWVDERADAAARRDEQAAALTAAARAFGIDLGDPTAENVRRVRDLIEYQQARRIGALTGLADAARRYNAEHADIPYSDEATFFDADPLGRFLREVVTAYREPHRAPEWLPEAVRRRWPAPAGLLGWEGVNNGGEPTREWGDLFDSDQPGRDDGRRVYLERALRRDQIRDERAVWAQVLGDVDLAALDTDRLADTLAEQLFRIQEAASRVEDFGRQADEFLRRDAEVDELAGLLGDMAAQEWVHAYDGVMFGDPAGIGLLPGEPMRLVVIDGRLEHDRVLADALARYPDLAAAVNDGTLDVLYKVTEVRAGTPLTDCGHGPERITVADAGAPRVRHLAGEVDGRRVDLTLVDDGDGWRVVPDDPVDPDPGPHLGEISRTEPAAAVHDLAQRLGITYEDLADPHRLATELSVLRDQNEIRAAQLEAIMDHARTAWDIDTYHAVTRARDILAHRIDPADAGSRTPARAAQTVADPATPGARRIQQISGMLAYAKELAALDPAAVATATTRLLRHLDALDETVRVAGTRDVDEAIRSLVHRPHARPELVTALTDFITALGRIDIFDPAVHGDRAVDPRVGRAEIPVHEKAVRHLVGLIENLRHLAEAPHRMGLLDAETDLLPATELGIGPDFARTVGVDVPPADLARWDDVVDRHRRGEIGDDDPELARVRAELARWNEVYEKYRDGRLDRHERLTPAELAEVQAELRAEVQQRARDIAALAELADRADRLDEARLREVREQAAAEMTRARAALPPPDPDLPVADADLVSHAALDRRIETLRGRTTRVEEQQTYQEKIDEYEAAARQMIDAEAELARIDRELAQRAGVGLEEPGGNHPPDRPEPDMPGPDGPERGLLEPGGPEMDGLEPPGGPEADGLEPGGPEVGGLEPGTSGPGRPTPSGPEPDAQVPAAPGPQGSVPGDTEPGPRDPADPDPGASDGDPAEPLGGAGEAGGRGGRGEDGPGGGSRANRDDAGEPPPESGSGERRRIPMPRGSSLRAHIPHPPRHHEIDFPPPFENEREPWPVDLADLPLKPAGPPVPPRPPVPPEPPVPSDPPVPSKPPTRPTVPAPPKPPAHPEPPTPPVRPEPPVPPTPPLPPDRPIPPGKPSPPGQPTPPARPDPEFPVPPYSPVPPGWPPAPPTRPPWPPMVPQPPSPADPPFPGRPEVPVPPSGPGPFGPPDPQPSYGPYPAAPDPGRPPPPGRPPADGRPPGYPGGAGPSDPNPPDGGAPGGMPYPPGLPPPGGGPQGGRRERHRSRPGTPLDGLPPGPGGAADAPEPLVVRPFAGFGVPSEFDPRTGAVRAAPGNPGCVSGLYGEIGGLPVVLYRQHGRLGLRIGDSTIDLEGPVVVELATVAYRTTRFALIQDGHRLGELTYRSLPEELDFGAYLRDVLADPQRRAQVFAL
ncbi:WXG100-like domain-containing protein [Nocardia testacea]|uniref:Outer membrane channel protein CpnT-like N-terminal domain-containing protein n=1 Tax=Nocardia testacea TaxID=248551 RepID=A0ABW7W0Y9_9NOCA